MKRQLTGMRPATLGDPADQGLDVWAWCNGGYHHAVLPIALLVEMLGRSYAGPAVKDGVCCATCGSGVVAANAGHANPSTRRVVSTRRFIPPPLSRQKGYSGLRSKGTLAASVVVPSCRSPVIWARREIGRRLVEMAERRERP